MWLTEFIMGVFQNNIILSCLAAILCAQVLKVVIESVKRGKPDFSLLFSTGGMPSGHTSTVSALAASVYLLEGISNLFVFSFIFAVIIIYDSLTMRVTVGHHTFVIKEMLKRLKMHETHKFRGIIGHTHLQVIMGLALGIAVALAVSVIH